MKPATFDYQRADSADVALEALAQLGEDARILTLFMPVPPDEAEPEGMLKKDDD